MTNAELATKARTLADSAPNGSPERRAAGCVVVALHTTSTLKHAREVLGTVGPEGVRRDALTLFDELTKEDLKAA